MILNKTSEQQALDLGYEKIMQELSGYWKNNQWDALDCPLYKNEKNIKNIQSNSRPHQIQKLIMN